MMNIDNEACIGCGLCVKDCFLNDIKLEDGKAIMKNEACFKCGHCIAVCPKGAVSMDTTSTDDLSIDGTIISDYNMDEVKDYIAEDFDIDAEKLLNFIKFRRTIRQFKKKEVSEDHLRKIIEAGRYTQTASNSQNVSYVVVRDGIDTLKSMAFETLSEQGKQMIANLTHETKFLERYAKMWINMNIAYKERNEDILFFHAPTVILVVSDSQVNASLASSNMELMTNALGLGTFFSGFFVRAAEGNPKIKEYLGLEETQHIVTCMIVGHPDVKYKRTAPRKEASVLWM